MSTLNIGCGNDKMKGAINADISPLCSPDVVCTLGERLPFLDNSFNEVYAYNVLTQIDSNAEFVEAINELWRICDGVIHIRVPLATHECAFQDPMDCRRFTDQSFTYMEYGHRRYEQYGKHYGFMPFKVITKDNNGIQMLLDLIPVK